MTTTTTTTAMQSSQWTDRVEAGDWDRIAEEVNEYGGALLPQLLAPGGGRADRRPLRPG